MQITTLEKLKPGEQAVLQAMDLPETLAIRLQDLGFWPGTPISCLYAAPSGSPKGYWIRGTLLALRRESAAGIAVRRDR